MRAPRRRWLPDKAGSVALIFALTIPVLVLLGGGVVDLCMLVAWRTQLQDALDSSAVAAVARNSPDYQAALTMSSDGTVAAQNASTDAQSVFLSNLSGVTGSSVTGFSLDVEKTGAVVNSTVTAQATFVPAFLQLVGIPSIATTLTSHASDNIPNYVNFYMLLDNTPSMGLGATTADINTLTAQTQCAFACHATTDSSEDYYTVARNLGVTLRIDVVRQATEQLMSTATATEQADGIANEYKVAIYDFGSAAYTAPSLNQVSALTSSLLTQSQSDASTIDLMTVPSNNNAYDGANNDEDTSFDYAFSALSNIMVPSGVAGNGASSTTPQPVLFFVTDGMVDMNSSGARLMGGISQDTCTALKSKGVKIAILYTTYLPSSISNDPWSQANVLPLLPQVAPALQSCASPGLYYEVSPSQGISQAMAALFQTVVASVRITS